MWIVSNTKEEFISFTKAIKEANKLKCNVTDEKGNVKWSPAPAVSAKRLRRYQEQKAAFECQEKHKTDERQLTAKFKTV